VHEQTTTDKTVILSVQGIQHGMQVPIQPPVDIDSSRKWNPYQRAGGAPATWEAFPQENASINIEAMTNNPAYSVHFADDGHNERTLRNEGSSVDERKKGKGPKGGTSRRYLDGRSPKKEAIKEYRQQFSSARGFCSEDDEVFFPNSNPSSLATKTSNRNAASCQKKETRPLQDVFNRSITHPIATVQQLGTGEDYSRPENHSVVGNPNNGSPVFRGRSSMRPDAPAFHQSQSEPFLTSSATANMYTANFGDANANSNADFSTEFNAGFNTNFDEPHNTGFAQPFDSIMNANPRGFMQTNTAGFNQSFNSSMNLNAAAPSFEQGGRIEHQSSHIPKLTVTTDNSGYGQPIPIAELQYGRDSFSTPAQPATSTTSTYNLVDYHSHPASLGYPDRSNSPGTRDGTNAVFGSFSDHAKSKSNPPHSKPAGLMPNVPYASRPPSRPASRASRSAPQGMGNTVARSNYGWQDVAKLSLNTVASPAPTRGYPGRSLRGGFTQGHASQASLERNRNWNVQQQRHHDNLNNMYSSRGGHTQSQFGHNNHMGGGPGQSNPMHGQQKHDLQGPEAEGIFNQIQNINTRRGIFSGGPTQISGISESSHPQSEARQNKHRDARPNQKQSGEHREAIAVGGVQGSFRPPPGLGKRHAAGGNKDQADATIAAQAEVIAKQAAMIANFEAEKNASQQSLSSNSGSVDPLDVRNEKIHVWPDMMNREETYRERGLEHHMGTIVAAADKSALEKKQQARDQTQVTQEVTQREASAAQGGHPAQVTNVSANVRSQDLIDALSVFGFLSNFKIDRNQVCQFIIAKFSLTSTQNMAFIEYNTLAAYQAAIAGNPLKVCGQEMFILPRQVRIGSAKPTAMQLQILPTFAMPSPRHLTPFILREPNRVRTGPKKVQTEMAAVALSSDDNSKVGELNKIEHAGLVPQQGPSGVSLFVNFEKSEPDTTKGGGAEMDEGQDGSEGRDAR
jgi:hypothetical protein